MWKVCLGLAFSFWPFGLGLRVRSQVRVGFRLFSLASAFALGINQCWSFSTQGGGRGDRPKLRSILLIQSL